MKQNLVDYLREEVPDDGYYTPKKGRNPSREKYLDTRKARNQNVRWLARIGLTRMFGWYSEYGMTRNGIIYFNSYRDEGRVRYLVNGWRRRRKHTTSNGYVDGRDDDYNWRRSVHGKSSRLFQRAWANTVKEAFDEYREPQ